MSCPAGEALPQHPRPRPRRWGRGRGAARRGPALGDPGRGPRAAPATPPPCCVHSFARGWWAPEPRGSGRRARRSGAAPRPCAPRPAPAPAPLPGRQGPGAGGGGAEPGLRARLLRPGPPDAAAGPSAPRAPRRRRRRRLLLSPPPRPPPSPDREPRARDLGSVLRGGGLRRPRHGAPGPRLVAAVCGRRAGRLRPRGPCQQEPELQRSPPDLRGQGLQPERRAPGGDLG